MALQPVRGRRKVYIIDEAHMLTKEASNAVLKTLEEPPSHAVFVLCTTEMAAMLPTIRSRSRLLPLARLNEADMDRALARALPEQDAAARPGLSAIAAGSPGRAVLLAEAGGVAIAALVEDVLRGAPAVPIPRAYEVADRLADIRERHG